MDWSEQIRELNDLHELLADGRKGYHEASVNAEKPQVVELLQRLSRQREIMQGELAAEIQRYREDDRLKDGTAKGALHQAWMEIRAALGKSDDTNMLKECERGEDYVLERYDAVLENPRIDPSAKQLLAIQRDQVQQNISLLRTMQRTMEPQGK